MTPGRAAATVSEVVPFGICEGTMQTQVGLGPGRACVRPPRSTHSHTALRTVPRRSPTGQTPDFWLPIECRGNEWPAHGFDGPAPSPPRRSGPARQPRARSRPPRPTRPPSHTTPIPTRTAGVLCPGTRARGPTRSVRSVSPGPSLLDRAGNARGSRTGPEARTRTETCRAWPAHSGGSRSPILWACRSTELAQFRRQP